MWKNRNSILIGDGTYERKLIEAFENKYDNIEVKLELIDFTTGPQKIEAAIKDGTICNVLLDAPGRIISYGKDGYLTSLEDMFTEEFKEDVNNIELIKACMDGDTPYCYPISSAPFYMVFNKKMLETAGVCDLVKEGWTTKDFTYVLEKLKENAFVSGSIYSSDYSGDQGTRAFIANLYSGDIINEDLTSYTINDEKGLKSLSYVRDAVANGLILNGYLQNANTQLINFANGRCSFSLLWGLSQQKSYQSILNENNIETVAVPYPSDDGIAKLEYLVNGFCVFKNEDEEVINASKKFVDFMCNDLVYGPQNVIQTGCFPVKSSYGEMYQDDEMLIVKWKKSWWIKSEK